MYVRAQRNIEKCLKINAPRILHVPGTISRAYMTLLLCNCIFKYLIKLVSFFLYIIHKFF